MGKKLFMDDIRQPPDNTWTVARTVEEAQNHLLGGDVDEASLDHDMGDPPCQVCDGTCDRPCPHHCHQGTVDGTGLVKWMIQMNRWPNNKPNVHSANPAGAQRMRQLIDSHGPYGADPVAHELNESIAAVNPGNEPEDIKKE